MFLFLFFSWKKIKDPPFTDLGSDLLSIVKVISSNGDLSSSSDTFINISRLFPPGKYKPSHSYNFVKPKYSRSSAGIVNDLCGKIEEIFQDSSISFSIAVISKTTQPHFHKKLREYYFILKGAGEFKLDSETFSVKSGDLVVIPPDSVHSLKNSTPEMEVIVLSIPPFSPSDLHFV